MSTLTINIGAIASNSDADKPGLLARLIAGREAAAQRQAAAYLAQQSDERLKGMGYSADDIRALRAGDMRYPA